MSEEELYNDIVEKLSSGDFLQLNGKAINLSELNDYINAQQQEIERLNNIIKEIDKLIEQYSKNDYYYKYNGKYLKSEIINDLKTIRGVNKE